jgi:hypothetical protein
MPRAKIVKPPVYEEQEHVYCYHGSMLFKAVVLEIFEGEGKDDEPEYGIHYFGWKDTCVPCIPSLASYSAAARLAHFSGT